MSQADANYRRTAASGSDANLRNTHQQALQYYYAPLPISSTPVPTEPFIPAWLEIACGQVIEDSVVVESVGSFYRTSELLVNLDYYAREVTWRLDHPRNVKFRLTGYGFAPYMTITRFAELSWHAQGTLAQPAMIELDLDNSFVGPFHLEVTSVVPKATGRFKLEMICDDYKGVYYLVGTSYSCTSGFVYIAYWGPRVSAVAVNNLLVDEPQTAYLFSTPKVPGPVKPAPYTWQITAGTLPPGLHLAPRLTDGVVDEGIEFVKGDVPDGVEGTYSYELSAFSPGHDLAAIGSNTIHEFGSEALSNFTIVVRKPLLLPDPTSAEGRFFASIWSLNFPVFGTDSYDEDMRYSSEFDVWSNVYDRRFIWTPIAGTDNPGIAIASLYAPDGIPTTDENLETSQFYVQLYNAGSDKFLVVNSATQRLSIFGFSIMWRKQFNLDDSFDGAYIEPTLGDGRPWNADHNFAPFPQTFLNPPGIVHIFTS